MITEQDFFDNVSDNDLVTLVRIAQGAPEYLRFELACFRVSQLTGKDVDYICALVKSDNIALALIEEANRVPITRPMPANRRGQYLIF